MNKLTSYKILIYCLLLPMLFVQFIQAAVTDSQVANWKDNKTAAFLLMFDDDLPSAYQVVIPELLKRNLIATFYVCPGGNNWLPQNQWEDLILKTGMIYGDHTWTHSSTYDLASEDREIRLCQEKIMSMFYTDGKRHLMSYGQPGVTNWYSYGQELTDILNKYDLINRPTGDGHFAVYHWQTTAQMLALADNAISKKGMEYLITHGVERRVSEGDQAGQQDFWALDKDIFRAILDGLVARRDKGDLWITDHISQYKYQMERDNKPTLQINKADDKEIQLTMTGTLDHNLYDLPLTVITQVPTTWYSAFVTQGTKTTIVHTTNGVLMYDALPDGSLITLTENTDILAPSAPTRLGTSTIAGTSFTLTWSASTDNVAVTGYDVYKGGVFIGSTTSTFFYVTGLDYNTPYAMTVKAKDATSFVSAESVTLNVTTLPSTYLVQSGGSGAVWSGVRGIVVDLTVLGKSFNEWYTSTTFTPANEVWLIKGTYTLTDTIATQTIENIRGGFAGTEQTVGDRAKGTNAWNFTNETIIDGNNLVRGIVSNTGATIDGLTIQNCMYAGAVLNTGTAAKITNSSVLQNCIVRNNTTTGTSSAGGVFLTAKGKLLNSYIHHNTNTNIAQNGGGIFVTGVATVDGCTITNNTAGNAGGGIEIEGKAGGTVVNNCIVSNNESKAQGGGGINATNTITFDTGTALTISNSSISSNIAKTYGGGISVDARVTVVKESTDWNDKNIINILNCVLNSNTALSGGGAYLRRGKNNLDGCTLNDNVSTAPNNDGTGGGGIFVQSSNGSGLSISNSIFKGNIIGNNAKNAGSAVNTSIATTFRNCLITGNKGSSVIYQNPGVIGTYQNCTFASNLNWAGEEVGMYLGWQVGAISTFTNCLFYKSTANPISGTINAGKDPVVTYCGFDVAIPSTYANKTGCITGLTSATFSDVANGDWSLSATSAAINAGIAITGVTTDISGITPRPQGVAFDMGAYENTQFSTGLTKINQYVCFSDNHSIKLRGLSIGTQLKVYSVTGILILNKTAYSSDVSIPLATGFYMVEVVDAGKRFTQKVIVR